MPIEKVPRPGVNVGRLNQEELAYELGVYGQTKATVDEMRRRIRGIERIRPEPLAVYPFKFEEEANVLRTVLGELDGLVATFESRSPSTGEKEKFETRVGFYMRRADRLPASSEQEETIKKDILFELWALYGEYLVVTEEEAGTEAAKEGDETDPTDSNTTGTSSVTESVPEPIGAASVDTPAARHVKVQKWGVYFAGGPQESLGAFLERIEELRLSRGASFDALFRSAAELLTGRALTWFRANKTGMTGWTDLVRELQKEFLPPDYDERLLEEIKRRTQAKEETMGMYVASMEGLFRRLTEPVDEASRLRVLRRNLAPFYLEHLGAKEPKTISELLEWGRSLELTRSRVENYVPPPNRRSNKLMEPDLAFVGEASKTTVAAAAKAPQVSGGRATRKCWNCGGTDHRTNRCPQPTKCFGCGRPDTFRARCPVCNPSTSKGIQAEGHKGGATPGGSKAGNEERVL